VVADSIRDSFNKIANSTVGADVKDLVRQLGEAVQEMTQHLPDDKKKEAAQDFDTVATEAAKAEPRKTWLKMAGDGLIGLAKTAGQTAVTTIVTALLHRLGV